MSSVLKEKKEVQDIWKSVFKTNELERFFNKSSLYNAFAEATILKVESKTVYMLLEKQDILEVEVSGERVIIKRKSRIDAEWPVYDLEINNKNGFDYFYDKYGLSIYEIEANTQIRTVFLKCF